MTVALPLAVLMACTALAAGCGDAPATMPADYDVRVRYDPDGPTGARPPLRARIRCAHDDGRPPCRALAALPRPALAPVPPTRACTMIYAGPQTVRVRGTLDGDAVDASISRRNGCEEARYQEVLPLLRAVFGERVAAGPPER